MKILESYADFFEKHYKMLLIIPIALLILSLIIIGQTYATEGSFVNKDVSLKGGLAITLDNHFNKYITLSGNELETKLKNNFPASDFNVQLIGSGNKKSFLITATDIDPDFLNNYFETNYGPIEKTDYNLKVQSSQFGDSFFVDTMIAILIAFIFMGLVVFIYFRTLAPSLAVILAALSDIIITIAVLNIFDIRLSTAGVAALLMLIGYSVDTDILLSTKLLKESKRNFSKKLVEPMKTGLMMSITTLVAVLVGLNFSISPDLIQIFTILLIGLMVDLIMTWIQNAAILRIYMEARDE